jgi:hypothetical protein
LQPQGVCAWQADKAPTEVPPVVATTNSQPQQHCTACMAADVQVLMGILWRSCPVLLLVEPLLGLHERTCFMGVLSHCLACPAAAALLLHCLGTCSRCCKGIKDGGLWFSRGSRAGGWCLPCRDMLGAWLTAAVESVLAPKPQQCGRIMQPHILSRCSPCNAGRFLWRLI